MFGNPVSGKSLDSVKDRGVACAEAVHSTHSTSAVKTIFVRVLPIIFSPPVSGLYRVAIFP